MNLLDEAMGAAQRVLEGDMDFGANEGRAEISLKQALHGHHPANHPTYGLRGLHHSLSGHRVAYHHRGELRSGTVVAHYRHGAGRVAVLVHRPATAHRPAELIDVRAARVTRIRRLAKSERLGNLERAHRELDHPLERRIVRRAITRMGGSS